MCRGRTNEKRFPAQIQLPKRIVDFLLSPSPSQHTSCTFTMKGLTKTPPAYCYLDFDVDNSIESRSLAAEFVNKTSLKYGLSSNQLSSLGGSELNRLQGFFDNDFDFNSKGTIDPEPFRNNVRIIVKLHSDTPLASENFRALCQGNGGKTGESGKAQTYELCVVHRVQTDFVLQSGDFVMSNGAGGESIYGAKKTLLSINVLLPKILT